MIPQDPQNDRIVLVCIGRPMDRRAEAGCISFELLEVTIEIGNRVRFDRGRQFAEILPLGNGLPPVCPVCCGQTTRPGRASATVDHSSQTAWAAVG